MVIIKEKWHNDKVYKVYYLDISIMGTYITKITCSINQKYKCYRLTIPIKLVKELELQAGQYVEFSLTKDKRGLLIHKLK